MKNKIFLIAKSLLLATLVFTGKTSLVDANSPLPNDVINQNLEEPSNQVSSVNNNNDFWDSVVDQIVADPSTPALSEVINSPLQESPRQDANSKTIYPNIEPIILANICDYMQIQTNLLNNLINNVHIFESNLNNRMSYLESLIISLSESLPFTGSSDSSTPQNPIDETTNENSMTDNSLSPTSVSATSSQLANSGRGDNESLDEQPNQNSPSSRQYESDFISATDDEPETPSEDIDEGIAEEFKNMSNSTLDINPEAYGQESSGDIEWAGSLEDIRRTQQSWMPESPRNNYTNNEQLSPSLNINDSDYYADNSLSEHYPAAPANSVDGSMTSSPLQSPVNNYIFSRGGSPMAATDQQTSLGQQDASVKNLQNNSTQKLN